MTTVEPHPIFHEFTVVNDEVVDRSRTKVPTLIRREERCEHCDTRRFTRINVKLWERIGSPYYRYRKDVQIIRITKPEWLKLQFISSTTLDGQDRMALQ